MQKRIISIILVLASVVCFSASCGGAVESAYDIAPLESEYAGTVDTAYTFDKAGVSEGLYSYIYDYYKKDDLDYYKSFVDYMGALSATESDNVAVEDTEKFWTAGISEEIRGYILKKGDEGEYTYADILIKRVDTNCKTFLAYEALADQYGYDPKVHFKDYSDKLSAAMIEAIKDAELYDDGAQVADDNGVLYQWVTDRWETYLAGYGITSDDWVRYFFDYSKVMRESLIPWLIENGHVLPDERESAIEDLKEYLEDYFEQIKKTYVKFEYIKYVYASEDEFKKAKDAEDEGGSESIGSASAESSEDAASSETSNEGREATESSEESADDTSSAGSADEEKEVDPLITQASTYEEYKKLLEEKCKAIFEGVKDGSLDFMEQIKACPEGAVILEENPNGAYATHEYFKSFFGKEAADVKIGDTELFVLEREIYILHYLAFDDKDMSTEPTEEDIEIWIENTAKENCMEILSELEGLVEKNSGITDGYSKPWAVKD